MASREKELLDRIQQLEEQNSALQDKLDAIWAVLASDYEDGDDGDGDYSGDQGPKLVQIAPPAGKKPG